MNRHLIYLWRLLTVVTIGLSISACTEDMDTPPPSSPQQISLACILKNSEEQTLKIRYSKPIEYSGVYYEPVEHVTRADLFEGDALVGSFTRKNRFSDWTLSYMPKAGKSYRLEIEADGQKLSATTTMPKEPDVRAVAMTDEGYTLRLEQSSAEHAMWLMVLHSSLDRMSSYTAFPIPKLADDKGVRLVDYVGTDHRDADHFSQEGAMSEFNATYGSTPAYYYYARLMPRVFTEGEKYVFSVQSSYGIVPSFVVLQSASVEYDKYLKTVQEKMVFHQSDSDPARWFDEVVVHSNVQGGLGIFAACSERSFFYPSITYPKR